jgi:aminoglycoside phosphotransferase (APT) family kinase protein
VVLLPFVRDADRPSAVIKVARNSAYEDSIDAEQAALASLRATGPASIRASLPEPLGPVRVLGQPGSAETYRPGASIAVRSTRRTARQATRKADLVRAAGWLHELQAATATGPMSLGPTGFDIGALSDRYARIFGSVEAEDRLFQHLRAGVIGDDRPVPQVMRHRDFGPWNVLVDPDGQLSVIDWEMAGPGPALVDLCYFAAHWCWIVAGTRSERSKARLLRRLVAGERSEWHINASRSVVGREARSLGLGAEAVASLFAWTFVEQALDRHDRLQAIGDRGAADRASNRYAGYVSELAEQPDLVDAIAGWLDSDRDKDP